MVKISSDRSDLLGGGEVRKALKEKTRLKDARRRNTDYVQRTNRKSDD